MLNKCLFFLLALFLPAMLCAAGTTGNISGEIITGYRVLTIDPGVSQQNFRVYRGDYIKFIYPADKGELTFSLPALNYRGTVKPELSKSPYFKMKKTGSYAFSLGPYTGKIEVIELVRPNYTAVTAKQANEILNNLHPFILDVRTPKEHAELAIPGSTLIPIQELQARINEVDGRKHEDVFIYCATGNRSTVAARILADRGFKRIYNLRYGVWDYAKHGFPVVGTMAGKFRAQAQ